MHGMACRTANQSERSNAAVPTACCTAPAEVAAANAAVTHIDNQYAQGVFYDGTLMLYHAICEARAAFGMDEASGSSTKHHHHQAPDLGNGSVYGPASHRVDSNVFYSFNAAGTGKGLTRQWHMQVFVYLSTRTHHATVCNGMLCVVQNWHAGRGMVGQLCYGAVCCWLPPVLHQYSMQHAMRIAVHMAIENSFGLFVLALAADWFTAASCQPALLSSDLIFHRCAGTLAMRSELAVHALCVLPCMLTVTTAGPDRNSIQHYKQH